MPHPKLSKLELKIMEILWSRGPCSIREIQEAFTEAKRPAYTTVQTTVYRLMEGKGAVKIVKRISNANIFGAAITRDDAGRKLFSELLNLFGGRTQPVMAHLVKTGQLTLDDIQETERLLHEHKSLECKKERDRK
jgi:BlaI family transcriptional regulator, penicillinase repressor